MENFTVRVQLRDADSVDYEYLHDKMEARGFYKTMIVDGIEYYLPDAEYNYSSDKTREEVFDIAYKIAHSVKNDPKILITKSKGRFIGGLDEV